METRPLTTAEKHLITWMLEHGNKDAPSFLQQLEQVAVTSWRCPCGCASFNLIPTGHPPAAEIRMQILADFIFGSEDDLKGIFLFEKGGMLAGIEVYGLTGDAPGYLPTPDILRPF